MTQEEVEAAEKNRSNKQKLGILTQNVRDFCHIFKEIHLGRHGCEY